VFAASRLGRSMIVNLERRLLLNDLPLVKTYSFSCNTLYENLIGDKYG
jgi:hypothetical protein